MKTKYDVITVGSALVDAFIPANLVEKKKQIFLPAGSKLSVDFMILSSGGGGTNSSVVLSKLGLDVGYLGKIGTGSNSNIILDDLKKYKVDFLGVKSKEGTGYSTILETKDKNRTILTYRGASNHLKYDEIKKSKLKTQWFHFTSAKEASFQTQKKLVDYAIKNNIKISYNPGANSLKKGINNIKKIIRNTTLLSMNLEEAKLLYPRKNLKNIFKNLNGLGVKIVCITDGKKNGYVSDGENIYSFIPKKVKAVECTGAGDTFASSMLAGIIKFNDLENSIKLALINSENVIQKMGAKHGLLTMNEAKKILKSRKFKIKKQKL